MEEKYDIKMYNIFQILFDGNPSSTAEANGTLNINTGH